MLFWIIFLSFLAGLGKATRDTIAHHFYRSIFAKIKNPFWFKWFESYWENKPHHPIWFLWDGWHFFDTLSYAVYIPLILICSDFIEIGIIFTTKILTFIVLYHYLFLIDVKYIPPDPPSKGGTKESCASKGRTEGCPPLKGDLGECRNCKMKNKLCK